MRIAVPAVIDPAAFAGLDRTAPVVDLAGATMGTTWSVRFVPPSQSDVAAVRAAIVFRLDSIVAGMSHWEPGSLLSRFNRAAAGSWTNLPPDFAHVIATALRIAEITDGAFDPAIGRLVDAWGFGAVPVTGTPDEAAIDAAMRASGWRLLRFDPAARRLCQPGGLALDLSGIAKGFAVDAVAEMLAAKGVRHALVEVGGELAGRGVRPDGEPWWVDLEAPPGVDAEPLRVALHGLAVATSGNYRRGDHNLDPRTGRPADHGVRSVSVLHPSAMTADAWATALTVGGGPAVHAAEAYGIAARILSDDGESSTPALAAMLEG
jgi:thiamine biosynthesis lipoprotein